MPATIRSVFVSVRDLAAEILICILQALGLLTGGGAPGLSEPPDEEKISQLKASTENAGMLGTEAVVVALVGSNAMRVEARGTTWGAVTRDGQIYCVGDKVRVLQINDLQLLVERTER